MNLLPSNTVKCLLCAEAVPHDGRHYCPHAYDTASAYVPVTPTRINGKDMIAVELDVEHECDGHNFVSMEEAIDILGDEDAAAEALGYGSFAGYVGQMRAEHREELRRA